MTSMQKDAVALIQQMPEERLSALLVIMRAMEHRTQTSRKDVAQRQERGHSDAFRRLQVLRRSVPDLNYEKELAEWREERFGDARAN